MVDGDSEPVVPTSRGAARLMPALGLVVGALAFSLLVEEPRNAFQTAGLAAYVSVGLGVIAAACAIAVFGRGRAYAYLAAPALGLVVASPWFAGLAGSVYGAHTVAEVLAGAEGGIAVWIGAVGAAECLRAEQLGACLSAGLGVGCALGSLSVGRGTGVGATAAASLGLAVAVAIEPFERAVKAMMYTDVASRAPIAFAVADSTARFEGGLLVGALVVVMLLGVATAVALRSGDDHVPALRLVSTGLLAFAPVVVAPLVHVHIDRTMETASRRGFTAHLDVFAPMELDATQGEYEAIVLLPDAIVDARRRAPATRESLREMLATHARDEEDFGTVRRSASVAPDARVGATTLRMLLEAAADAGITELEIQGVASPANRHETMLRHQARPIVGLLFPTLGAMRVRLEGGFTREDVRGGYRGVVDASEDIAFVAASPSEDAMDDIFQLTLADDATAASLAAALRSVGTRGGLPALVRSVVAPASAGAPTPEADVAPAAAPPDSALPDAAPSPAGAAVDPSGQNGGEAADTFGREAIQRAFRGSSAATRRCYERALSRAPQLTGRVAVDLTLGEGGRIEALSASSDDIADRALLECIETALRQVAWPDPGAGQPVRIRYPLVFQAAR